ncbi:MAG: alpha/beta fold hydrolase [Bacteroidota bacterium]
MPTPNGRLAIGYWRTALSTDRLDTIPNVTGTGKRTLLLEVWYPAAPQRTQPATKRYTTPAVENALISQLGLTAGWAGRVKTHAVEGASPLTGKHPVVIFSHGLSWPMSLYQSITEDLASRGYIVVGINHPHGTTIDFGDGHILEFSPVLPSGSDSARVVALARLTAVWAQDIRAVLDQINAWGGSPQASPLSANFDLARVALVGHSLGGSAAAHLTDDPRVRAVAVLEGQLRDTAATTLTVRSPFLHMIGEYNRLEMENRSYLPSERAPVYQAIVAGTGHAYFSDLIAIYKSTAAPDWLARHRYELEPGRIIQITRDYVAAFLGRYLLDTDDSLLHPTGYAARVEGPRAAGYAEVRLTIDVR